MNDDQSRSGSSAAVVIAVVLVVLLLPCMAGLLFVGGIALLGVQAPQPIPLPPVPGANAPLPVMPMPGNVAIPADATITVNSMKSSQNLYDQAEEILTLAKYDELKPGMTYDELLSVLAIPENKRPDDIELVGPESDVELKWFGGPDEALSITVKMRGKVVVSKSQTGLE